MLGILESIANTVITMVQFVADMVKSLISFIQHIPTYLQILRNVLNLLPSVYVTYSIAFVVISSVLYALGRQQNNG